MNDNVPFFYVLPPMNKPGLKDTVLKKVIFHGIKSKFIFLNDDIPLFYVKKAYVEKVLDACVVFTQTILFNS
jgi:hypothetical protein